MSDTLTVLKDARALISDESRWTARWYAFDKQGQEIWPTEEGAATFCAAGAIIKTLRLRPSDPVELGDREITAVKALGFRHPKGLVAFNDAATHAAVVELFDKAIAKLEAAS